MDKNSRYFLIATIFIIIILSLTIFQFWIRPPNQSNRDILFQTAPITFLREGNYFGNITYGELKKHGDFGLGTFNGLDGEMVGIDGTFYQVKDDGIAYPVDDSIKTPFALVTFFEADKIYFLEDSLNYTQLKQYLDFFLPREDIFYALKIEGEFEYIKARSFPKQMEPTYPVIQDETIFEFHDISGTIVGFWIPDYMEGIYVPGYHFHFITEDRMAGGHLLECQTENLTVEIDYTYEFSIVLSGD